MITQQSLTSLFLKQPRFVYLFLLGCIPTRLMMAYIAKQTPPQYLPYLGGLALLPVIGWAALVLGLWIRPQTALGDNLWWGAIRTFHIGLYLLFARYAYNGNTRAWYWLALDALFGLSAFVLYRTQGWSIPL